MKDDLGLQVSLEELGAHHIEKHLDMSSFSQSKEGILQILGIEESRYEEMLRKGEAAVKTALRETSLDTRNVSDEILFRLSEERGLNPEMVVSIAHRLGWEKLSIRVGLSADMAARNAQMTKAAAKPKSAPGILSKGLSPTSLGYYEDTTATDFEASVLSCSPLSDEDISVLGLSGEVNSVPSHAIILDHTLFYPEGGGQLGDQGTLSVAGTKVHVLDTRIEEGVVLHLTDSNVETGKRVKGNVDWTRRKQLMDHHTAIHIVGGAAREELGPHVWQAGSNKGARYARLDITHHTRLSRDELDKIEDRANDIIASGFAIEKLVLDREEADSRFGFEIYQGGPPKHDTIRVIKIGQFDIQACGGTHHDNTESVDELRIIRSSQVQDGVERLQVVAGDTAREHSRRQDRLLNESSEILGVQPEDLPRTVNRFFEEWKYQQKRIESLESEIVRLRAGGGGDAAVEKDGIRYVVMESGGDTKQMMGMLGELTRDPSVPTIAVLGSRQGGGFLVVASTEGTIASEKHNAVEILQAISPHISGEGGGRPTMAQGGGTNPDGIPASLEEARNFLGI